MATSLLGGADLDGDGRAAPLRLLRTTMVVLVIPGVPIAKVATGLLMRAGRPAMSRTDQVLRVSDRVAHQLFGLGTHA
ncbi:MAG TPA: hypothetical protein VGH99_20340 [Pseudonocardia sp.]|jgi:hypothetical protein